MPNNVELFFAVKANPDTRILEQVAHFTAGLEIASGGELELIQPYLKGKPFIFGGPGKLDSDIDSAMACGVDCLHVESIGELRRVIAIAEKHNKTQSILLRINPVLPDSMQTTLTMAGRATAFGIDEAAISDAVQLAQSSDRVELLGFHVHALSHQLDAGRHLRMLDYLLHHVTELAAAHNVNLRMVNLGGGIGINYRETDAQYVWPVFADGIRELASRPAYKQLRLRFEMGRYLTAACGYYLMEVLDLKENHGEHFAICRGGTHQFRLPAAQGHSHPFACLNNHRPGADSLDDTEVTIAGQLCTPKILSPGKRLLNISRSATCWLCHWQEPMPGIFPISSFCVIRHRSFIIWSTAYECTGDVRTRHRSGVFTGRSEWLVSLVALRAA
ncbi:type III PLP-dependent enzyme [Aliamphritea spongicola]|nr:type III PLP-dependent enzyme [Aliamphritea spongicola]